MLSPSIGSVSDLVFGQHFFGGRLRVIAEGVETREQLQFLREAECNYYQGFLGRPPLSAQTFREELQFNAELYAPIAKTRHGGNDIPATEHTH